MNTTPNISTAFRGPVYSIHEASYSKMFGLWFIKQELSTELKSSLVLVLMSADPDGLRSHKQRKRSKPIKWKLIIKSIKKID